MENTNKYKFIVNKSEIEDLYIRKNTKIRELAEFYGVCIGTINNTLKSYNLRKRTKT